MASKYYPRHITRPDGALILVHDHHQHSAHMGQKFGPDAEPAKMPPSLQEILAAGYSQEASESIFRTEQAKAEQGIEPYGDKPQSEFVPPTPDSGSGDSVFTGPDPSLMKTGSVELAIEPRDPPAPFEPMPIPEVVVPITIEEVPQKTDEEIAQAFAPPVGTVVKRGPGRPVVKRPEAG